MSGRRAGGKASMGRELQFPIQVMSGIKEVPGPSTESPVQVARDLLALIDGHPPFDGVNKPYAIWFYSALIDDVMPSYVLQAQPELIPITRSVWLSQSPRTLILPEKALTRVVEEEMPLVTGVVFQPAFSACLNESVYSRVIKLYDKWNTLNYYR